MKNYKLKKELHKYFNDELKHKETSLHQWEMQGISIEALEQVVSVNVILGYKHNKTNTSLNTWDGSTQISEMYFTVSFQGVTHKKYRELISDKVIKKMRKNIEKALIEFKN